MDINRIPRNQLGMGSHIALEPCETEHDLYWKMAIEVLEVIAENNKRGEPTVMIVPYGPVGPYARLAWLVNKYRLSLKNCYFANMDEYLDEDGQWMDKNHPFSFRGGMERSYGNMKLMAAADRAASPETSIAAQEITIKASVDTVFAME